jgi:hypothetical protein
MVAASGNERVFELLHSYELDLDLQDDRGWTPLIWASNAGRAPIVERLLALGANINIQDKMGRTALHWAADRGHANAVAVLAGFMTEHELDIHALVSSWWWWPGLAHCFCCVARSKTQICIRQRSSATVRSNH